MRNTAVDVMERRLYDALKKLPYVKSINFSILNDETLSANAVLTKLYFIDFYYNKRMFKLNFALIYRENDNKGKRIWALDRDNRIGWHLHPLNNVGQHEAIEEKTIEEIVEISDEVWQKIQQE